MKTKFSGSVKLIIIGLVFLLILIIGTIVSMHIMLRDVQTASGYTNESYSRHYAFIHTDEDPDFWDNVYQGALDEGSELGVYVEDFGADLTVDYDRNQLIQTAIDASVDGIIIDGDSDEETSVLIDEAAEAGIPVVTVLDDCADSERISFVGISSYAMGRQYGELISDHIDEDDITDIYVMMDSAQANSGQELVISGISDVLTEAGYEDLFEIEGIYADNAATFSAEEQIRDIFLNGDAPDAIVALNSVYTKCLFQVVVDLNMVGDVYIYGFHDSTSILEAVSKDIVEATLAVDTSQMGQSAVDALQEYLDTGYVSDYISQDTEMISGSEAAQLLEANEDEAE